MWPWLRHDEQVRMRGQLQRGQPFDKIDIGVPQVCCACSDPCYVVEAVDDEKDFSGRGSPRGGVEQLRQPVKIARIACSVAGKLGSNLHEPGDKVCLLPITLDSFLEEGVIRPKEAVVMSD